MYVKYIPFYNDNDIHINTNNALSQCKYFKDLTLLIINIYICQYIHMSIRRLPTHVDSLSYYLYYII